MEVPELIKQKVEEYEFHRPSYLQHQYKETEVRRRFIEPFFRALNWDMYNDKCKAESYKEVVYEDNIQVKGKSTKFADYSFRIGKEVVFIVEAKKPSIRLKDDADSALQLRRYGWNKKLKLSILTNFEEFIVFDCTIKPEANDKASQAQIKYLTYKDYVDNWDWIDKYFSKKSIEQGSLERYVETKTDKKGTLPVDDAILQEIENWRDKLAQNIALRNHLSLFELNITVQRIIDRILFLRICEDRGIEEYGGLEKLASGSDVYKRLCEIFVLADKKYNSGLFHFFKEPGWEDSLDLISLQINVDDKVLKDIIKQLYFPSPYIFSAIPPEILGQVYERFLGKVIYLTEGGQARSKFKDNVKKEGGVFYTPQYIVDYIVSKTVGELVAGKTPTDISSIKVLDPACGSGSFLIGTYQYLLDWHRDWYIANLIPIYLDKKSVNAPEVQALIPKGLKGDLPVYKILDSEDSRLTSKWKLTIEEKKRILLNNIFGVDIDLQAVEVTKLSLLLKVLEGEKDVGTSSPSPQSERALPNIDNNIKCGNSLISTDIYADVQVTLDNPDVERRINAFDWSQEFPEIMKQGGFSAVIGNPPYVRQELIQEYKNYFKSHYSTYHGSADLFVYFIEKGISLLQQKGIFSYIVANKWMRAKYGTPLRTFLLSKQIEEIVDFGDLPVFSTATTYPCIIRVRNDKPSLSSFSAVNVATLSFSDLVDYVAQNEYQINPNNFNEKGWTLIDSKSHELMKKIQKAGIPLQEYIKGNIFYGIKTGLNKAFVIDEETRNKLIQEDPQSAEIIKPFLAGKDIKRYQYPDNDGKYLIFTRHGIDIKKYPAVLEYLKQFKKELMPKPKDYAGDSWSGRKPGSYKWYEIQDTIDYYLEFEKPRIIIPAIVKSASYTFDERGIYSNDKTSIIPVNDKYLLGILNSKGQCI